MHAEGMLTRGQNDPEQIRRCFEAEDWCFSQQGVPETLMIPRAWSKRYPRSDPATAWTQPNHCRGSALC